MFDGNDLPSKAPASVNEGSLSTDSGSLRIGVGEMNWLSEEGRITGRFVSTSQHKCCQPFEEGAVGR